MKAKKGFIYIMTNQAFPDMVKIGFAKDVEARRKQLSTTALPYEYEVYATYETASQMTDKQLHKLIDSLNPDLRVSKNREFYNMQPDKCLDLFIAIAKISGTENKINKNPLLPDNPIPVRKDALTISQACVDMKQYLISEGFKGDIAEKIADSFGLSRKQVFFYLNLERLIEPFKQLVQSGDILSNIQPIFRFEQSDQEQIWQIAQDAQKEGVDFMHPRERFKQICDWYLDGKHTWAEIRFALQEFQNIT